MREEGVVYLVRIRNQDNIVFCEPDDKFFELEIGDTLMLSYQETLGLQGSGSLAMLDKTCIVMDKEVDGRNLNIDVQGRFVDQFGLNIE